MGSEITVENPALNHLQCAVNNSAYSNAAGIFFHKLTSNSRIATGMYGISRDVSSSHFPGCFQARRRNLGPQVCKRSSWSEYP